MIPSQSHCQGRLLVVGSALAEKAAVQWWREQDNLQVVYTCDFSHDF